MRILVPGRRTRTCSRLLVVFPAAVALVAAAAAGPSAAVPAAAPSLLLITLDTTRADHLGCYGAASAATPTLDGLAARGTRWATAIAPSPLTLPAHASLLTALAPPEHGLRDNGASILDPEIPTLATLLTNRGYATAAFVSSRVLDRRFGLARGFATYDDRMAAEATGEYGYPERDAAAVTAAAIRWLDGLPPASRPYFLWVHYYDPHAPYQPPEATGVAAVDYAGEIAFVDRQVGRLLAALPGPRDELLVAAVGDHGEALGEHGERTHGLFLYRSALEVPLIVAGPGVPAGRVVDEVVPSRRLAPTLLGLLGFRADAARLGTHLPGLPTLGEDPPAAPAYSESWMPASAYGWSPLRALTDGRWRLIVAPRPELYDWRADPAEAHNLFAEQPAAAARLSRALSAAEGSFAARGAASAPPDPELDAALRSLGYLSGSGSAAGTIDPKDGVAMLEELARAKELLAAGDPRRALAMLRELCRRSPDNIPFLTQLAGAELATGDAEAAIASYRRAIGLNPRLDFLHLNLAEAYLGLGRREAASGELRLALGLDPRSARAWLGLAELAHAAGDAAEERRLLLAAVAAETGSATIRTRLGQIESAAGDYAAAETHFRAATELAPAWVVPWLLWGEIDEARQRPAEALERYRRAAAGAPDNAQALLHLGRLEIATGAAGEGRRRLERVVMLAPGAPEAREARRLLAGSPPRR